MTLSALGKITPMGAKLAEGIKSTRFFYDFPEGPSLIYKATKDIPEWGLEKGDYLYGDSSKTHKGDHIEVFHKDGAKDANGNDISRRAKDVRNIDGSRNHEKRKQAFGWEKNKKSSEWEFKNNSQRREIDYWINQKNKIKGG